MRSPRDLHPDVGDTPVHLTGLTRLLWQPPSLRYVESSRGNDDLSHFHGQQLHEDSPQQRGQSLDAKHVHLEALGAHPSNSFRGGLEGTPREEPRELGRNRSGHPERSIIMPRKLISTLLGIAALASLAGPAIASATNTPTLTVPTGTDAALGTKLVGTSADPTLLGTGGETILTCASATLTGELTKNSGGIVEGSITSATFVGTEPPVGAEPDKACVGVFTASVTATLPLCARATTTMNTDEFQIRGGKCPEAAKAIVFHLYVSFDPTKPCTYERAASSPITGTFSTHPSDAVLTVTATAAASGFTRVAGSFLCPSSVILKMSATLESESVQPAYIDG